MRHTHYLREHQALDNATLSLEETLFHTANGYIGVRGAFEEGYPEGYTSVRGSYINGVYDVVPMPQAEPLYGLITEKQTLVNVADVQDIKLYVEGELCTPFHGELLESRRVLDMKRGTVERSFTWKASRSKRTVRVSTIHMTSFVRPSLFLLKYTVIADGPCTVCLEASHRADVRNFSDPRDPRVATHSVQHIAVDRAECGKTDTGYRSTLVTHTGKSLISVVTSVEDSVESFTEAGVVVTEGDGFITRQFALTLEADVPLELTRYAVFTDSLRHPVDPAGEGKAILDAALQAGTSTLMQEQAGYLDDFWHDMDFGVDGDDSLSSALTFNIYQLLQSVGKDGQSHLSAKGLSGEGYEGHYFWDTEMYVQPLFTLTRPEISRQLLAYRYSILPRARENARALGHRKGALYPWRTISGVECSGFFPAGTAQYHIDGAIAYAVVMYYLVTRDEEFMESMGLEMLVEIARLWIDLGTYHEGRFHLHCVTGPDEYTCIVNNNYYTNISAKHDLEWAVRLFREFERKGRSQPVCGATGITESELQDFSRAAQAMYIPYDEGLDITPQDDSFLSKKVWDIASTPWEKFPLLMHYHPLELYRYQVCKQADTVLGHFLYEDSVAFSTMLNSFRYYEKITTHDSSLSTCIFSIVAARLGLTDEAYAYFGNSVEIDLHNTHGNTKDGIHTANMGGSCLAILFGFAGLRIKEDGFYLSPSIPAAWQGYHVRLKLGQAVVMVRVTPDQVSLRLVESCGAPGPVVFLYGRPVIITDIGESFPLEMPQKWLQEETK